MKETNKKNRLSSKAKVPAPISKILRKWTPMWALTSKAWEVFNNLCGENFGSGGKTRPIQYQYNVKEEEVRVY
jgi:hypothetical protein